MTPEELAARHPRLYHVTKPGAVDGIRRHGLLPTSRLLDLFEVSAPDRIGIEATRRPTGVRLHHPTHGTAILSDNVPLSAAALLACLDDGLTPEAWLRILNARVFFWADQADAETLLAARLNRGQSRDLLVFDTLGLARAVGEHMELCPINSGSTIRRPARRGLGTFTPLLRHGYADWRTLRGKTDRIREVTVVGGVPDAGDYLVEVRRVTPAVGSSDMVSKATRRD